MTQFTYDIPKESDYDFLRNVNSRLFHIRLNELCEINSSNKDIFMYAYLKWFLF